METLRSPKQLAGPALGIPVADLPRLVRGAVRPRRMGRARQDPAPAVDGLPALVPRGARAAGAQRPSRHRRAGRAATASSSSPSRPTAARRRAPGRAASCVATGRAGLGGPSLPAFAEALPRTRWAHSSDDNDYAALAGPARRRRRRRRLGDGQRRDRARSRRRARAPAGAPRRPAAHQQGQGRRQPGLRRGLRAPARRLEMAHPPLHQHAAGAAAAQQHAARLAPRRTRTSTSASPIDGVEERDGALQVRTSAGPIELDFLIFATGFKVDWRQRPMLRRIAPCIRVWKDRYPAPAGDDDAELAESPDLGAGVRVPAARRARTAPASSACTASATRRRSRSA